MVIAQPAQTVVPCFERYGNRQAECVIPSSRLTNIATQDDCLAMCETLGSSCAGVQYSVALRLCDVFGAGGTSTPTSGIGAFGGFASRDAINDTTGTFVKTATQLERRSPQSSQPANQKVRNPITAVFLFVEALVTFCANRRTKSRSAPDNRAD